MTDIRRRYVTKADDARKRADLLNLYEYVVSDCYPLFVHFFEALQSFLQYVRIGD